MTRKNRMMDTRRNRSVQQAQDTRRNRSVQQAQEILTDT